MPIGDAEALIYTSPIFVIVLSALILGHRIGVYKSIIALLTILGAWFIVEPSALKKSGGDPLANLYFTGVFVSLATAFCNGVQIVTMFRLQKVHPFNLMLNSGISGLLFCLILGPFDSSSQIFTANPNIDVVYLLLSAILGIIGLLLCLYSGQILIPILFCVLRCQEVVISFIFQAVFQTHLTSLITINGALLVISGSIFIPLEQMIVSKIPIDWIRNIF